MGIGIHDDAAAVLRVHDPNLRIALKVHVQIVCRAAKLADPDHAGCRFKFRGRMFSLRFPDRSGPGHLVIHSDIAMGADLQVAHPGHAAKGHRAHGRSDHATACKDPQAVRTHIAHAGRRRGPLVKTQYRQCDAFFGCHASVYGQAALAGHRPPGNIPDIGSGIVNPHIALRGDGDHIAIGIKLSFIGVGLPEVAVRRNRSVQIHITEGIHGHIVEGIPDAAKAYIPARIDLQRLVQAVVRIAQDYISARRQIQGLHIICRIVVVIGNMAQREAAARVHTDLVACVRCFQCAHRHIAAGGQVDYHLPVMVLFAPADAAQRQTSVGNRDDGSGSGIQLADDIAAAVHIGGDNPADDRPVCIATVKVPLGHRDIQAGVRIRRTVELAAHHDFQRILL